MLCLFIIHEVGATLIRHRKNLQLDCPSVTHWDVVGTPSQLGRISNLRPFLDSSAQITLGEVLDFFRKISKRARCVVFGKRCFPEGFQAQNMRFELKSMF